MLGIADRALGLTAKVAACFPDHRAPNRVEHRMVTLVRQRVFAIAMGYEDLNDHHALRDDALLQLLAGRTPEEDALASPSTLCRFENQREDARLLDLMGVLIDTFIASYGRRRPTEPLILDASDRLRVTCTYDTSDATNPVVPGWGTENEMCLVGMLIAAD